MTGKILFFNASDGKGIIITSDKKKFPFGVEEWDDFDVMPSLGLEVTFQLQDKTPTAIASTQNYVKPTNVIEKEEVRVEEQETTTPKSIPEVFPDSKEENEPKQEEESTQKESEQEFFAEEIDINEIKDEEELTDRKESVTISLNVYKAVENYFDVIEENIEKRQLYKKVKGRLNYLLTRRFLWTIYNNLGEIDVHIIDPQIRSLAIDLKAMAKIHYDFMIKTKYPHLAYAEVFLSCQAEYLKIKDGAEKTVAHLRSLKGNEQYVGSALRVKKEDLQKAIDTEEFEVLQDELRSLNGAYVDTVHMMAELDEKYKHDMKILKEFEKEYRDDFYEIFARTANKYKADLIDILSAQAYILDEKLWQKAKRSKAIKAHFQKASIVGEFNTRTYLKYYLKPFKDEKMSDEIKKLSDLYEYLCDMHKEYVLIVVNDPQDAMEFKSTIRILDKEINAISFIDPTKALKWAMKNSVRVLVLENPLPSIHVETFLKNYKKYILSAPKIIILGDKPKSNEYSITKILSQSSVPMFIAKNIQELYNQTDKTTQD